MRPRYAIGVPEQERRVKGVRPLVGRTCDHPFIDDPGSLLDIDRIASTHVVRDAAEASMLRGSELRPLTARLVVRVQ
jgi:hypothetical protein